MGSYRFPQAKGWVVRVEPILLPLVGLVPASKWDHGRTCPGEVVFPIIMSNMALQSMWLGTCVQW